MVVNRTTTPRDQTPSVVFLQFSLSLQNGPLAFDWAGHELLIAGSRAYGFINNKAKPILFIYSDGTYPGANGTRFVLSGFYMLP
jgi:hypothetical protein